MHQKTNISSYADEEIAQQYTVEAEPAATDRIEHRKDIVFKVEQPRRMLLVERKRRKLASFPDGEAVEEAAQKSLQVLYYSELNWPLFILISGHDAGAAG